MILISFIIGTFATVLGALPPGASNLAVIKITLQEGQKESLKVSYGASIGEMLLAFIAFSSGMVVQDFFKMHLWIQYLVAALLAVVGIYFFLHKKSDVVRKTKKQRSKYLLGFTLSIINPPVLIFWIFVFSLLSNFIGADFHNSTEWLLVFLAGVFLGKFATLYGYSKMGLHIQKKKTNDSSNLNRYIGLTLVLLAFMQVTKLVLF